MEHICRVVAGYVSLRVTSHLPAVEPCRPLLSSLNRLATLSCIGESGDPACWAALKVRLVAGLLYNIAGMLLSTASHV